MKCWDDPLEFINEAVSAASLFCSYQLPNVASTHNAYLNNGTDIGLTVDNLILAYVFQLVNIYGKITLKIQK